MEILLLLLLLEKRVGARLTLFASGKGPPRYWRLLSTNAGRSMITCSDVSSSFLPNLHVGYVTSPIVCLCFRKVPCPVIIPTTVFALFLLNSCICSAHPSISESFMKVLAVRHPWAFFHASECFLEIHLSISALITVSHIPVAGSDPIKISFLACLASLSAISFPFIQVWPGSQKMVSGRLSASRFRV